MMTKLLAKNPTLSFPKIGNKCGRRWKKLGLSKKSRYKKWHSRTRRHTRLSEVADYLAEKEPVTTAPLLLVKMTSHFGY